jgi:hypothetical protein
MVFLESVRLLTSLEVLFLIILIDSLKVDLFVIRIENLGLGIAVP